ncbi:MAG: PD-(D/E)XK nuclease family transposase [Agathobacter sp.]|nr:PD-(D/E)XK nuclease family transposase [Agathobacter sp.]
MINTLNEQPVNRESHTIADILGSPISAEEAMERIKSSPKALQLYSEFPEDIQEKLLSFIQGGRGLPILYDTFFKQIMDPILHPHRLEQFLSTILEQKVRIKQVLQKEGTKLSEKGSLVIMDIVLELEDGSIIDVEMQKVGYQFTGARSSCYSSDLVMRQYNRMKSQKKQDFRFKDMKPVYLIILMEHSAKEFAEVAPAYIHRGYHQFDSGAKIDLLTNILYISLDTFHDVVHNITNKRDAWLTFLSSDRPEDILQLVKVYPEFMECYQDIVEFRKKPEELMSMYTDAFIEAERNTVKYMCEEQQKEIKEQRKEIQERQKEIQEQQKVIESQEAQLKEQRAQISEQSVQISEQSVQISEQSVQISEQRAQISEQSVQISEQRAQISEQSVQISDLKAEIAELGQMIQELKASKE